MPLPENASRAAESRTKPDQPTFQVGLELDIMGVPPHSAEVKLGEGNIDQFLIDYPSNIGSL